MLDYDADRRQEAAWKEHNTRSLTRFAVLAGFSVFLSLLWPQPVFPVMLAGFLFINAVVSAAIALYRRDPVSAPHFTRWDEAAAFYVCSFLAGLFIDQAVIENILAETGGSR